MTYKTLINNLNKVKNLESVGRPEASWVLSNREILMRQINPAGKKNEQIDLGFYFKYFADLAQQKVLRPALVSILVFCAYFGSSAFFLAAKASLPGDTLYPIKVLGENVQMAATISDEAKVKLKMDFISRRGDELQQIARQPDSTEAKSQKISATVQQITADVNEVKTKIDQMSSGATASAIINTAKVVDDKTLKVEKDIVDAHALLPTEVKKEVAADVKTAIATAEIAGTSALATIVDKSAEQQVKDSNQAVSDKEIVARVSERIKSSEIAVEAAVGEVNKIATGTIETMSNVSLVKDSKIVSSTDGSADNASSTLKEAVADVTEKPKQAQTAIAEAKTMLDKKDFNSALIKITESKAILADVIEKAPLIDAQIKDIASSTAASTTAATTTPPGVKK